ncbi:phage portal protein [uncultured Bacteroides sp.]|uniref:phage portal protein n=1 Tax=uncultured Bacteroides sp. TaxID=162156 RepID=UPI00261F5891|nr:phage portal protein [uncultured Bacteroides sp.]
MILDSIRNLFKRSTSESPARMGISREVYSLSINGNALNVSTAFRCINLLSDSVANLPLQVMRFKDGIFVEDREDHLHYLLNVQPCSSMSAFDFWKQTIQYLLTKGNAYIVPMYIGLDLDRLVLVDPTCVAHDTNNDIYTINDSVNCVSGTFKEEEIIHIKNYSYDGKNGISTLSFAKLTTDIALSGDNETLNRFVNGGNVRGIVSNDTCVRGFGEYQDSELGKTADDLDSKFRSGKRIVSLPGQVQFNSLSLSSTDMQFLETRKFTAIEVCRFFGVHPSFVFADVSNNYKSAEMANVAFLSNTLNPLLRKIEIELHRKLISPALCCKRKFQFDRKGLYACDLESKVRYINQTIASGLYTVNEWRKEENMPSVEGGDRVLVSANLKSINEFNTKIDESN